MRTDNLFSELDSLNARKLPVRGAYLDIFRDLVSLREISRSIFDRSLQAFDKEYEEVFEIRKNQETVRAEIRELQEVKPTPESTLRAIPEIVSRVSGRSFRFSSWRRAGWSGISPNPRPPPNILGSLVSPILSLIGERMIPMITRL